jgi:hypothetical protein
MTLLTRFGDRGDRGDGERTTIAWLPRRVWRLRRKIGT